MKWSPSPPELLASFDAVVPGPPAVRRKMFGYPAAFVNGNMFMGLFRDQMILRLPEAERKELLSIEEARPFEPMPGRPMREYVAVPPAMIERQKALSVWVKKAYAYGSSLPPKPSAAWSDSGPATAKSRPKAKPSSRPR